MTTENRLYVPTVPTNVDDPENLRAYLYRELFEISRAFDNIRFNVVLDRLAVAPTKPVDGQIAYADGTNWNPGSGAGMYVYKTSTSPVGWDFLG